jgi:predicted Zn-dependent peptidase
VTDDELNLAKSAMAGGFARSLESPQTIARFALNIIRENLAADYYQTLFKKR